MLYRGWFALGVLSLIAADPSVARAQGYSADIAPGKMTLADDLEVRLVASEPLVRQPVAIDFDDRGRLWVIQYLQYPNPEGLTRVAVDRFSRTKYDRVPEPPPRGPKGADRLTILEDRDGDGVMDHAKDFVSGLNLMSGFAFGNDGVYVLQAPYLLFYPDANRDDIPDGDPKVLLGGFGMEDAHSVANSLTWGPDGWLYGLQGSTVTANLRGVEFQQGFWRYHPRSKRFELFFEGGGNMWGLDFDTLGNAIASTNYGPHIAMHATQGGYGWKSFGKHGALHDPYAFGYFEHCPHEGPPSGHVTVGGFFYDAPTLPERFRGKYIAGDLLRHCVRAHEFLPDHTTFRTKHFEDVLIANDASFATSDLTLGPDGCIYVADWNDKRTAHPDPDADWDRSNGRIYAIGPSSKSGRVPQKFLGDLESKTPDELYNLLSNDNVWYRRRARRIIADKGLAELKPRLAERLETTGDLDALWTLAHAGWFDQAIARKGAADRRFEHVRAWSIRLIGDEPELLKGDGLAGDVFPRHEPSPAVRLQRAATAKQLVGLGHNLDTLLAENSGDDLSDPRIPLHLWWALESYFAQGVKGFDPGLGHSRLERDFLIPRIVQRLATDPSKSKDLLSWLDQRDGVPIDPDLKWMDNAWRGRGKIDDRPLLSSIRKHVKVAPTDPVGIRLLMRLGDDEATRTALDSLGDTTAALNDRLAMVELAGELAIPVFREELIKRAKNDPSEPLQTAALNALARFDGPEIADLLLVDYSRKPSSWQAAARRVLMSRSAWAKRFLNAVEAKAIDPAKVPIDEARSLANLNDGAINAAVRKHWGNLKPATPEAKLAEVRRLNNDLNAGPGRRGVGRAVFQKHCQGCHQFHGEGAKIGPDLTTANRGDRQFLLVSLVDPSVVVRKEFQTSLLALKDGRVVAGLIGEQSANQVTLIDSNAQKIGVSKADIDEIKDSEISLMPEDLYKKLSPTDLRDLFQYLQSDPPK